MEREFKDYKSFEFEVSGAYALFSIPASTMNGYKMSYPIPTYSALIGITESVYWKPSLRYVIEKIRVMNPIKTETITINHMMDVKKIEGIDTSKQNTMTPHIIHTHLAAPTIYLKDVRYQVKGRFEFNKEREDLKNDWVVEKHSNILQRSLKRGGRLNVFLGTSECPATVTPCVFGEGEGFYDNHPDLNLETMFHSFKYEYIDGITQREAAHFFKPEFKKGIVTFEDLKE